MLTLISSTILRLTGKIDQDIYVACTLIGLVEILLTGIMAGAIIDQLKTGM